MEIVTTYQGQVARVQLHRPDLRNSFNPPMIAELQAAFVEIPKRKDIRAIILSGAGSVFCAGADLNWMRSMADFSEEQNKEDATVLYRMFQTIFDCPIPVIGQVHGSAFGGALGLIATCDLVLAEAKTQFCFSEVKLGLAPAVISSFIARKCLLSQAAPWMLNGAVMNADQALDLRLVDHVIDGFDKLEIEAIKQAKLFSACGPEAVRATKMMLRLLPQMTVEQQKVLTIQTIAERRVSPEGQEGLRAFLEKRRPQWSLS